MVLNNQWPFEHAGRNFYAALTEQLVAAAEEMLHHVQPGESDCHPSIGRIFNADLDQALHKGFRGSFVTILSPSLFSPTGIRIAGKGGVRGSFRPNST